MFRALLVIVAVICMSACDRPVQPAATAVTTPTVLVVDIEGMHCTACAAMHTVISASTSTRAIACGSSVRLPMPAARIRLPREPSASPLTVLSTAPRGGAQPGKSAVWMCARRSRCERTDSPGYMVTE